MPAPHLHLPVPPLPPSARPAPLASAVTPVADVPAAASATPAQCGRAGPLPQDGPAPSAQGRTGQQKREDDGAAIEDNMVTAEGQQGRGRGARPVQVSGADKVAELGKGRDLPPAQLQPVASSCRCLQPAELLPGDGALSSPEGWPSGAVKAARLSDRDRH